MMMMMRQGQVQVERFKDIILGRLELGFFFLLMEGIDGNGKWESYSHSFPVRKMTLAEFASQTDRNIPHHNYRTDILIPKCNGLWADDTNTNPTC